MSHSINKYSFAFSFLRGINVAFKQATKSTLLLLMITGTLNSFAQTYTWVQKSDPRHDIINVVEPPALADAVGFSISSKGYIETGDTWQNFREYDPTSNTWTQKLRSLYLANASGWVNGPGLITAPPELIAWYPFNGNAQDETGNGYNGTVSGATLDNDRFGNPMSAYSFDGIDDKIVIGQEPNFPSWDTYAVSLWFLNDGGGDQGRGYGQKILSKAQFYTDFHLSVLNDENQGYLSWWSAQGGGNSVNDLDYDYRDNQWHHVVLNKHSPGNGDMWVDGVLQNSSSELQAVFNSEDLVIGFTTHTDGYQQKHWSGKIDDIRIYNGVLSEPEILDLFTEGGYCFAPTNLKVVEFSDTSATLSWDAAGVTISSVQLRYRAAGAATWTRRTIDTAENMLFIDKLAPNTTYNWQLRNLCSADTSGWVIGPDFITTQQQLIAWYPFNGNAQDETGNGYNGTVSGATLGDDRFCNPMSAYSFDGIDDKIVIGKEPNFPSWDTYAVSLWFLNDGGGNQGRGYGQKILSKAQYFTDFHLSVQNDDSQGRLTWWSAQGGFNGVDATNQDYRDNQWHHVVLNKHSPSNGDIWVDGLLQNTSNTLQAVFNSEDLVIGFTTHTDGYQQKYWSGKIDDIAIYDGVLSESEILDLFTEGGCCFAPANLKVVEFSDTSATLSWDAAGATVSYVQLRYRAAGATTWTRRKIDAAKNMFVINNLAPNTTYNWQLRSLCSADTSGWVNGPDFTTSGVLPLQLISFNVALQKTNALLKWQTANEINASYFNIQRSFNGMGFNTLAKQSATGISTTQQYLYTDVNVTGLQREKIFYRLQSVDKDGSSAYSNIAELNVNNTNGITFFIYPNPAKDKLQVNISCRENTMLNICIVDMYGNQVYTEKLTAVAGNFNHDIDISMMAKGVYIIQFINNKGTSKSRFAKE